MLCNAFDPFIFQEIAESFLQEFRKKHGLIENENAHAPDEDQPQEDGTLELPEILEGYEIENPPDDDHDISGEIGHIDPQEGVGSAKPDISDGIGENVPQEQFASVKPEVDWEKMIQVQSSSIVRMDESKATEDQEMNFSFGGGELTVEKTPLKGEESETTEKTHFEKNTSQTETENSKTENSKMGNKISNLLGSVTATSPETVVTASASVERAQESSDKKASEESPSRPETPKKKKKRRVNKTGFPSSRKRTKSKKESGSPNESLKSPSTATEDVEDPNESLKLPSTATKEKEDLNESQESTSTASKEKDDLSKSSDWTIKIEVQTEEYDKSPELSPDRPAAGTEEPSTWTQTCMPKLLKLSMAASDSSPAKKNIPLPRLKIRAKTGDSNSSNRKSVDGEMGESSSSKRKISESSEDQQTAKKRRISEAENEKPKIDQILKGYLCLECNLFFADKKGRVTSDLKYDSNIDKIILLEGFFMHSKETKHPKSQSVAHFLGKERQPSLKLRDLAYSQNHGHSVRKRIKRAVKAGDLSR